MNFKNIPKQLLTSKHSLQEAEEIGFIYSPDAEIDPGDLVYRLVGAYEKKQVLIPYKVGETIKVFNATKQHVGDVLVYYSDSGVVVGLYKLPSDKNFSTGATHTINSDGTFRTKLPGLRLEQRYEEKTVFVPFEEKDSP